MALAEVTSENNALPLVPSEAAFQAILPEIAAMPDEPLPPVNIDLVEVVTKLLGLLPGLRALRPQIQQLPGFNVPRYDKLEQYALALSHAYALHRGALVPKTGISALGEELVFIRDGLYASALAVAHYGLIDGERFKECKKVVGYRATATDVLTLVPLFKEHWSDVQDKVPVTAEALNDASNRAVELLAAVGLKDQAPVTINEAAQRRQKAFTLLVRAYDDVRRAVQYLRADAGDADELAPSLYAGRGGRRREEELPGTATPPGSSNVGPTTPRSTPNGPAPTIEIDNSAGLPIDHPFTSN